MAWDLVFTRRAGRDLEELPPQVQHMLLDTLRRAAEDPGSVGLAKLKGRPGEWRIRAGRWRILLELSSSSGQIIVSRILDRRDAYR